MESKRILIIASYFMTLAIINVIGEQPTNGEKQFDTMIEQAKAVVQNMSAHFQEMAGIPHVNTNETQIAITQAFLNQTKLITNQVQEFMTKVHTAATEKDGFLTPVIAQLNETVNSLQTAELQKQTKNLQDVFTQSMNSIVEQMGKVAAEVNKEAQPNGNLYQIAANATEKFIEITKNFENKVHETVKHKH